MSSTVKEAVEIAKRNALVWAGHIERVYLPYLDRFSEVAREWVAPALSDERITKAANEIESKVFNAYPGNEDTDPADVAEHAFNISLEYYMTVGDVRWALFAMEAAALYHLVEQQLCDLCRLAFGGPDGVPLNPGQSIELLKALGIDVTTFIIWPRINELRHLANCVKHAEGNSCEQLRKLRPDLFENPTLNIGDDFKMRGVVRHVRNPLMGEDIYVTEQELAGHTEVVRQFWMELASALAGC
ncbi:MAG: hypothetical protein ACLQU2_17180 [Candidatus Binataceae bacterium]